MDRDSRDKFAADLRRQEVISPDWRKVRLSALFAVVLALAGLGLGRLDTAYTGVEYTLYAAASAFGVAGGAKITTFAMKKLKGRIGQGDCGGSNGDPLPVAP
jgi:hypothetical protein